MLAMVKYFVVCLVLVPSGVRVNAFVAPSATRTPSTGLRALPTMIIGPLIKKMREERAQKKMPMARPDERVAEAPGLRVGTEAWKWPPVWPYDSTFFVPKEDIPQPKQDIASMAGLLTGQAPTVPTIMDDEEEEEGNRLNVMQYWGVEKADATTDLDRESVEKLKSHYAFYLRDGMSVLELGAAEQSYLPEGLKLSRHVGVGANQKLMNQNPSLSENIVADLNDVIPDRDVNSDELRRLATEPFDAIIMANTADFLTNPREVFRSAWYLLKPGGIMINAFSTKAASYSKQFERVQTRMWRDYNDDQHMWVCGSFFQFSAGDGWENLKGFDISPASAKEALDDGPLSFMKQGKQNNMYVVQASKAYQDDSVDPNDPEKSFRSMMWMLPTLEERDKILVAPRLSRAYQAARNEDERKALEHNVQYLPKAYECLMKMDTFSFGFGLQSQLAADLVVDPSFTGNDDQILALKQGLGLRKPSPEFWTPVGENTSAMTPENKINLLSHLVPRFGSGNPDQEAALQAFVDGMKPTYSTIRQKCPDLGEGDVQLLGTELLAAEILIPGTSTREEFAAWLGALSEAEMKSILAERTRSKTEALDELQSFRAARAAAEAEEEAQRNKMREQVMKAREERTMIFNPRTGKMEPKAK